MALLGGILKGAGAGAVVSIVIKAVDDYSKNFKKLDKQIASTNNIFKKNFLRLKKVTQQYGVLIGAALGFATVSVKAFIDTERAATAFNAVLGDTADIMLTDLRKASKGLASDFDLMNSANKALALGIDKNQLPQLLRTAAALGKTTGRTVVQAFEDISIGIGRQSRLILDNLGIILDLNQIWDEYEEATGKSADALDDFTRKQIIANKVIEEGTFITELMELQAETTSEKLQRLGATAKNVASDFGAWIVTIADTAVELGKVGVAYDLWADDIKDPGTLTASKNQLGVWKGLQDNTAKAAESVKQFREEIFKMVGGPFLDILQEEEDLAKVELEIAELRKLAPGLKGDELDSLLRIIDGLEKERDGHQLALDVMNARVGVMDTMIRKEDEIKNGNIKTTSTVMGNLTRMFDGWDNVTIALNKNRTAAQEWKTESEKEIDAVVTALGRLESWWNRAGIVIANIATFGGLLVGRPGGIRFDSNSNNQTVGDAIIRPNGDVIRTHPNDTLIATQNPGGTGITFIVQGDLIGLDAEDISRSLSDELNTKVSI